MSLAGVVFALDPDPYHPEDGVWVHVGGLAMFLFVAAAFGRGVFGQSITASADGLLIQGVVMRTWVDWSDFQSITPGSAGLVITRRDGSVTVASAVQKAHLYIWTKRQRRADHIANEIAALAQRWGR
jgi:hypothetical protein